MKYALLRNSYNCLRNLNKLLLFGETVRTVEIWSTIQLSNKVSISVLTTAVYSIPGMPVKALACVEDQTNGYS